MGEISTESEADERLLRRMAEMLADQLRMNIVCECNIRELSPRKYREAFGGPTLAKILESFEALERVGWIERVPGSGGPPEEGYDRRYRASFPTTVDDENFAKLPDSVKSLYAMRIVESLSVRTREGMQAGTIAARDDGHLTWSALMLDQRGWEAVTGRLKELLRFIGDAEEDARARMAESGEEPILMTVGLLGFESPRHR